MSKVHSSGNSKCKGNGKPNEEKKFPPFLQMSKVKTDNHNNSKLKGSTDPRSLKFCKSNTPIKPHNCLRVNNLSTPNTPKALLKKPTSVLKRKSISLVELTSNTPRMKIWTSKKWKSKEYINESKTDQFPKTDTISPLSTNEADMANKVCKMFILNAWRHQRTQVSLLEGELVKKGNEVDNLNIQVVVLRNLLESEKLRVAAAMSDAAHLKLRLENEIKETNRLKNDLNILEIEKTSWKKLEEKMDLEIQNLQRKVTSATEKNNCLIKEVEDFKKTIIDTKEKEYALQKELGEVNKCIKEKENVIKDIQKKYGALVARTAELTKKNQLLTKENEIKELKINECICRLKKLDLELNNSQKMCKAHNETIVSLKKDMALAEETMKIRQDSLLVLATDIENLKNTVEEFQLEKEELKKGLTRTRNRVMFEAIKISGGLSQPSYRDL